MPFAHPHEGGAMRWVATNFHLEKLARRVDSRAAKDLAVVFATLLVGALLWLALAHPMPAQSNRVDVTKSCVSLGRA